MLLLKRGVTRRFGVDPPQVDRYKGGQARGICFVGLVQLLENPFHSDVYLMAAKADPSSRLDRVLVLYRQRAPSALQYKGVTCPRLVNGASSRHPFTIGTGKTLTDDLNFFLVAHITSQKNPGILLED
ncbi:unnamed protein product [Haemonchus placei]|uniref:Uncharacterized protein n=1 Tax=Haemonchus placei TaxID=6290 RepID=A0A0N4VYV6_HAEPC|nr:unnamed protein product [Haemonchus placei]